MKYIIDSLPHGIGKVAQSEADFLRICDLENIEVIWSDSKFSFHCSTPLGSFITLPKRLKGIEMLFAAFHELGHHYLSAGRSYSVDWLDMPHGRDEREADAVALVAIVPASRLHRLHEILDIAPKRAARRIYDERRRLNFFYGI